jgi:hypothetical protein
MSILRVMSIRAAEAQRARDRRNRLALGAGIALGIGLVLWNQRRRAAARMAARGPVTQATATTSPADAPIGPAGANLEQRLDEALEESFPASDPVSVHIE